jgi:hypothetical protein
LVARREDDRLIDEHPVGASPMDAEGLPCRVLPRTSRTHSASGKGDTDSCAWIAVARICG